jgi:chromosome segregation ATPase
MPESPEPAGDDLARQLRAEIALVRADAQAARMLAAGADRDVSEVRAELRSHTRVLNALRQTQVEQGRAIDELRSEVGGLRGGLGELRIEMRTGFATLASGMADITTLLQRGIDD